MSYDRSRMDQTYLAVIDEEEWFFKISKCGQCGSDCRAYHSREMPSGERNFVRWIGKIPPIFLPGVESCENCSSEKERLGIKAHIDPNDTIWIVRDVRGPVAGINDVLQKTSLEAKYGTKNRFSIYLDEGDARKEAERRIKDLGVEEHDRVTILINLWHPISGIEMQTMNKTGSIVQPIPGGVLIRLDEMVNGLGYVIVPESHYDYVEFIEEE